LKRTNSQEEIRRLEETSAEIPFLATMMDLTIKDLDLLKEIRVKTIKYLEETYNLNLKKDRIEFFFHFPYAEATTTLHLHIRINQEIHPLERARSISLDEVIATLEKDGKIIDLIMLKNPYYIPFSQSVWDMLNEREGISIKTTSNPYKVN